MAGHLCIALLLCALGKLAQAAGGAPSTPPPRFTTPPRAANASSAAYTLVGDGECGGTYIKEWSEYIGVESCNQKCSSESGCVAFAVGKDSGTEKGWCQVYSSLDSGSLFNQANYRCYKHNQSSMHTHGSMHTNGSTARPTLSHYNCANSEAHKDKAVEEFGRHCTDEGEIDNETECIAAGFKWDRYYCWQLHGYYETHWSTIEEHVKKIYSNTCCGPGSCTFGPPTVSQGVATSVGFPRVQGYGCTPRGYFLNLTDAVRKCNATKECMGVHEQGCADIGAMGGVYGLCSSHTSWKSCHQDCIYLKPTLPGSDAK